MCCAECCVTSMRTGMCWVDGDDTYPAEDVHTLLDTLDQGWDMVVGDRTFLDLFHRNKRPFHNTGNRLVRSAINSTFHAQIRDVMSGVSCVRQSVCKGVRGHVQWFRNRDGDDHFRTGSQAACDGGANQYRDRPEGSTSKLSTFSDGAKVLNLIFRLAYENRPLPFFGTLGGIIGGVGLGLALWVCIEFAQTGMVRRFPAADWDPPC